MAVFEKICKAFKYFVPKFDKNEPFLSKRLKEDYPAMFSIVNYGAL